MHHFRALIDEHLRQHVVLFRRDRERIVASLLKLLRCKIERFEILQFFLRKPVDKVFIGKIRDLHLHRLRRAFFLKIEIFLFPGFFMRDRGRRKISALFFALTVMSGILLFFFGLRRRRRRENVTDLARFPAGCDHTDQ